MKLEETGNLKLQSVKNIQTTTSQLNNIHDTEQAEKYHSNIKYLREKPKL